MCFESFIHAEQKKGREKCGARDDDYMITEFYCCMDGT
jgi:hypothetical protein